MAKLIRDQPFIQTGALSGRYYFVSTWIEHPSHVREAVEKVDVTDDIEQIIANALREREREDDEMVGVQGDGYPWEAHQ